MPDPAITGFVPKWFRDQPFDAPDEVPVAYGTIPDHDPKVITRLVPKDHGFSLPARIVSRVIDLKQDLALHAARDIVEGINPNFTDLTSVSKILREAAQLAIEPSEPGSFIIPASMPVRMSTLNPDAVLRRYGELLAAIDDNSKASTVSIGALQVCRQLSELLKRGIESIEVTTYDNESTARPTVKFTNDSVASLDRLLNNRRTTTRDFEQLTGRLEALDIGKNEFQLSVPSIKGRVKGSAAFFAITTLKELLGSTVTLEGEVVRERKSVTMTAYRIVNSDAE